jgi:hypothetical protein
MEINEIITKYAKPSNTINGVVSTRVEYLGWWFVKEELPQLLIEGQIETILKAFFDIDIDIENQQVINFIIFVQNELVRLNEFEVKYLSSQPEPELVGAGIHKLNVFGNVATLESLSSNVLDWENLMKLPYDTVLKKLMINKTKNDIEKSYNKIMIEKAKLKK